MHEKLVGTWQVSKAELPKEWGLPASHLKEMTFCYDFRQGGIATYYEPSFGDDDEWGWESAFTIDSIGWVIRTARNQDVLVLFENFDLNNPEMYFISFHRSTLRLSKGDDISFKLRKVKTCGELK